MHVPSHSKDLLRWLCQHGCTVGSGYSYCMSHTPTATALITHTLAGHRTTSNLNLVCGTTDVANLIKFLMTRGRIIWATRGRLSIFSSYSYIFHLPSVLIRKRNLLGSLHGDDSDIYGGNELTVKKWSNNRQNSFSFLQLSDYDHLHTQYLWYFQCI